MTETPNDDQPGFVAEEPEHCFACLRRSGPGQETYQCRPILPERLK